MSSSPERVISITLSDEDWRAFVKAQPQPVHWLRERIHEIIATTAPTTDAQVVQRH
jgi:hypothetical protein